MMHAFSRRVCFLLNEELFTRDSQHNLFKLSRNISIRMFEVSDLWQWINSPWGTKVSAEDETWRISQGILKCTRLIISAPKMSVARKMELHRETVITILLLYSSRTKKKKKDLIWRNKNAWNVSSVSFPLPRNAGILTYPFPPPQVQLLLQVPLLSVAVLFATPSAQAAVINMVGSATAAKNNTFFFSLKIQPKNGVILYKQG